MSSLVEVDTSAAAGLSTVATAGSALDDTSSPPSAPTMLRQLNKELLGCKFFAAYGHETATTKLLADTARASVVLPLLSVLLRSFTSEFLAVWPKGAKGHENALMQAGLSTRHSCSNVTALLEFEAGLVIQVGGPDSSARATDLVTCAVTVRAASRAVQTRRDEAAAAERAASKSASAANAAAKAAHSAAAVPPPTFPPPSVPFSSSFKMSPERRDVVLAVDLALAKLGSGIRAVYHFCFNKAIVMRMLKARHLPDAAAAAVADAAPADYATLASGAASVV